MFAINRAESFGNRLAEPSANRGFGLSVGRLHEQAFVFRSHFAASRNARSGPFPALTGRAARS
jgi:hypothetical protein